MEFQAWPKTPRLFRPIVITEKIDGTNAAVIITGQQHPEIKNDGTELFVTVDGGHFAIGAQSRKRLITPASDNFGFASWVAKNADSLVRDLGVGRHYGEWWGSGVQRGYGLQKGQKLFSLFNVNRYAGPFETPELRTVPTLYTHNTFDERVIRRTLEELQATGSKASYDEGVRFNNPEGIIVFHTAANSVFKVTYDDGPKGEEV